MVRESVGHLKNAGKEVMLDLEHFFDGYKANANYTMQVSRTVGRSYIFAYLGLRMVASQASGLECFLCAEVLH